MSREKNENSTPKIPVTGTPKLGGILSLPPEQLHQMAQKYIPKPSVAAKGKLGGIWSLPPEQLHQMAQKYGFQEKTKGSTPKTPVTGTPIWGGIWSLPPEQLQQMAKKYVSKPSVAAKGKLGGIWSLPLEQLHQMSQKYGFQAKTKDSTPRTPVDPKTKWAGLFGFSSQELHQMGWDAANFTTVAGITSASIVAVQSPIKTLLVNLSKYGVCMFPFNGGAVVMVRTLYAGTSASLSGSAVRTVYVTGAKNSKPIEVLTEEVMKEEELIQESRMKKDLSHAKLGYILSVALGDILVTQIPESLSTLRKIPDFLPKDFKWYTPNNAYQLMSGGFVPRYTSGLVNFAALCILEDYIASSLPIKDKKAKHFAAGTLSGSSAAFFAYPFSAFKDYTLVQATLTDGQLSSRSTFEMVKELSDWVRRDPKQAAQTFFRNAGKQVPLRMTLTGVIFSLVSGVGETLGTEPLSEVVPKRYQPSVGQSSQGFFVESSKSVVIEEVTSSEKQQTPNRS